MGHFSYFLVQVVDIVSECCFVLLVPTPEAYGVPRASPGVTASKLFLPTSLAYFRRRLRRALLQSLELNRVCEAPFLERAGRLPLGQASKREEAGLP